MQLEWCDNHGELRYRSDSSALHPSPPNNFVDNMASLCFLLFLLAVKTAFSAKILGYSAFGSGSHYHIVSSPLQELASRGHEVLM